MKKIACIFAGISALCFVGGARARISSPNAFVAFAEEKKEEDTRRANLQIAAKSAYLCDYHTNTVVFEQEAQKRLPIASMCKIMTLLLSFDALRDGRLALDEEICVSERAASMGGSQVFLEANAKYPVRELLKSIVVCSANDSCVAMAERIAGSEELFVDKMNVKARVLGANDTLFANCTGLPKEPQYSCAKDVATMLRALLENEEYYAFSRVWTDKFAHPKGRFTEITNTNKLVRFYEGCDGGKTGFTNEAGFCLAATAKRGDMRVISVVIGEKESARRFQDVRTMFDYAFANYTLQTIVDEGVPLNEQAKVVGGKEKEVNVVPARKAYAFARRGERTEFSTDVELRTLRAPCEKGDVAGELIVYRQGVETERVPLLAYTSVAKATLWDEFKDVASEWNRR